MKKLVLLFLLIGSLGSFAQKSERIDRHAEYGFGLVGMNYMGDLSPRFDFKFYKPGAQVFYRHNLKDEVSVIRFNLLVGQVGAKATVPSATLPGTQELEFSSTLIEVAAIYEYDFFNYRDLKNMFFMSPYLYGGLAGTPVLGNNTLVTLPFGVGLKIRIGKTPWNVGMEFGARKTWSDRLDNIADDETISSSNDNDWYYVTSLTISKTLYEVICKD